MRPTLALTAICKNEESNITRFLDSFGPVVDNIYITDTGSTDKTLEKIKEWEEKNSRKVNVLHFDWINDFAAARNHALSHIKEDYWIWADLDDSLQNPDMFTKWRDTAMGFVDYWLCTYHYAHDANGNPACSFIRERVIKTSLNLSFKYFVHEGVIPDKPVKAHQVVTWAVKHERTTEDLKKDKGRNLKLFDGKKDLDARMTFYLGKEQFENDLIPESFINLVKACADNDIQMHDRILAFQYAAFAANKMNQPERAAQLMHQALQLDPKRAEFYCILGDSYAQRNQLLEAVPSYIAAKSCSNTYSRTNPYSGAIFSLDDAYTTYPRLQLAKIYANIGDFEKAKKECMEVLEKGAHEETQKVFDECDRVGKLTAYPSNPVKTEDIVFTSPPYPGPYEWDEEIAKTKGMGGSETACIEMAKNLKKLTGRRVIVFNHRDKELVGESGVEYVPSGKIHDYITKYEPKTHIAWRHNIRLTNGPSYLWCHDLVTPGVEFGLNADKLMCLTPFHRDYVHSMQGVPLEKMLLTRNGIIPERFKAQKVTKDPMKICFVSSPDRGLEHAIPILDIVREKYPIQLSIYYGLENLYKYGLKDLADKLTVMINERKEWIHHHGFTQQDQMIKELSDCAILCHPATFIESSMISAVESLLNGIFMITRRIGAIPDTMKWAEEHGMCKIIDHKDDWGPELYKTYADEVCAAIENRSWEAIDADPERWAWKNVAAEWVQEMGL